MSDSEHTQQAEQNDKSAVGSPFVDPMADSDVQPVPPSLAGSAATTNDIDQRQGVFITNSPVEQATIIGKTDTLIIQEPDAPYDVRGLPNPYLGLRSFTYADRTKYAGRQRAIEEATRILTAPGAQCALLFITGASGSGKSSFAEAGLVPALEAHYRELGVKVRRARFRPSQRPLDGLADALTQLGISMPRRKRTQGQTSLINRLATQTSDRQVNLIVLDQFEELFTQSEPKHRDALFALLEHLPPFSEIRTHFIVTLRIDYLPELFDRKALNDIAKQGIELRAMTLKELKDAINAPLQQLRPQNDKRFEQALLEKLARDAAPDATYLPLLQVTLEDMWARGLLKLSAYESLTDAIRERAEAVHAFTDYDGARTKPRSTADQEDMLQLFLALVEVSLDDEARRDVRRRRSLDELVTKHPQRTRLIDDLVHARLLSKSVEVHDDGQIEVVDIIHETLISNWDRLRHAVIEQRAVLQQRVRFEQALREWEGHGRTDDYLLDGVRLAEAETLGARGDVALERAVARLLLQQSLNKRETLKRRQLRRIQQVAVALSVLLLVAAIAFVVAFQQQRIASNRLIISESQRLAALSQSQLAASPEVALLLAYEAVLRDHNSISEQSLRDALDKIPWIPVQLPIKSKHVNDAGFSPDGNLIFVTTSDATTELWKVNGEHVASLVGNELTFNTDGSLLLTTGADNSARLWNTSGQLLQQLWGHSDVVRSAEFQPNGRLIITRADKESMLWDIDGRKIADLKYRDATFSPSGDAIITYSGNETIFLDASGKEKASFEGALCTFSPDGKRLVTSLADGTIIVWNINTGAKQTLPSGVSNSKAAYEGGFCTFSPDGKRLVTSLADGTIIVWNIDTGAKQTLADGAGHINHLEFDSSGKYILIAYARGVTKLWNMVDPPTVYKTGRDEIGSKVVYGAKFHPDGNRFVVLDGQANAQIYSIQGQLLFNLTGHAGWIHSYDFSPDGNNIATASDDATARIWDMEGHQLAVLSGHTAPLDIVKYRKDGEYILTASWNGEARVWRKSDDIYAWLKQYNDITSMDVSRDGNYIATGHYDGKVRLWNQDGSNVATLNGHQSEVRSVVFSADGKTVLTSSTDTTARLWDLHGKTLAIFTGHTYSAESAVFSPDGSRVLTSSDDQTARIWDLHGNLMEVIGGDIGSLDLGVFSPNGLQILTSGGGMIQLWSRKGGNWKEEYLPPEKFQSGNSQNIGIATFSPDGLKIIVTTGEGDAILWNLKDQTTTFFQGHTGTVSYAIFSKDGSRILTASYDGSIRLWKLSGEPLAIFWGEPKTSYQRAIFSHDERYIYALSKDGTLRKFPTRIEDVLAIAACRVGRGFNPTEQSRFAIDTPQFDFTKRQC